MHVGCLDILKLTTSEQCYSKQMPIHRFKKAWKKRIYQFGTRRLQDDAEEVGCCPQSHTYAHNYLYGYQHRRRIALPFHASDFHNGGDQRSGGEARHNHRTPLREDGEKPYLHRAFQKPLRASLRWSDFV